MRQWELRGVSTQVKRPVDEPVVMVEGPQGFRSLIDQVPAICWTTDADLRFTSALGAGWAELWDRTSSSARPSSTSWTRTILARSPSPPTGGLWAGSPCDSNCGWADDRSTAVSPL